ncbi:MAG: hypothetical protein D6733_02850 [Methanobacteriota archaeon]|nr:MAG: hypothetical protein D6733_02850 [Euryarchaeota archaeon]
MEEEGLEKSTFRRFIRIDPSIFTYESFLGLGFESVFIAVIAGVFFGFIVAMYPAFRALLPFLPSTNIFLFIAFGVPLTGSAHFDPRLGMLSSSVILLTARSAQLLLGIAPYTQEFLVLAGIWSITLIFLIGYLPGKLIPTSESLGMLFRGMVRIALLYAVAEEILWGLAEGAHLQPQALLIFPVQSVLLLITVSTLTTFIFTNTFCPYMMIPLISGTVKGQRQCSTGNFVFKLDGPISVDETKIKEAGKRGFRLVSRLPTVTVFSCPLGGMISVYHSGEILIRKVNKGQAERMNRHLSRIMKGGGPNA